jgi:protocatechuate 3,4-dioxygenase beta subunit
MPLVYPTKSLENFPKHLTPGYKSTVKRSPSKPLIVIPHTLSELTGPVYGHETVREHDHDLTIQGKGEPIGERIIVHGHVLDEDGRGVPNTLVELWQANACGRYIHVVDQHSAPLDPNFTGAGRAVTDAKGNYKFVTMKPGAYPWGNHHNAWRPAHIHIS